MLSTPPLFPQVPRTHSPCLLSLPILLACVFFSYTLFYVNVGMRDFQLLGSQRYPTRDWLLLGQFRAENTRKQAFRLATPAWARFLKVRWQTHHGDAYYCSLTGFWVTGATMLQDLTEEIVRSQSGDSSDEYESENSGIRPTQQPFQRDSTLHDMNDTPQHVAYGEERHAAASGQSAAEQERVSECGGDTNEQECEEKKAERKEEEQSVGETKGKSSTPEQAVPQGELEAQLDALEHKLDKLVGSKERQTEKKGDEEKTEAAQEANMPAAAVESEGIEAGEADQSAGLAERVRDGHDGDRSVDVVYGIFNRIMYILLIGIQLS